MWQGEGHAGWFRGLMHFLNFLVWVCFVAYFVLAIRGIWPTRHKWYENRRHGIRTTNNDGTNEHIWIILLGFFLFVECIMFLEYLVARIGNFQYHDKVSVLNLDPTNTEHMVDGGHPVRQPHSAVHPRAECG